MAEPKFEKDLERLEQIVEALETGGLSLDESLKRFEEGIKLARRCEKALTEAERKIEVLTQNARGEIVAEPFAEEEGEGESSEPAEGDTAEKPRTKTRGPKEDPESETGEGGGLLF